MAPGTATKNSNSLPLWGNDKSMNLNSLILTNIQSSHYFKVNLFDLKTYHEVIDEIYYKVTHLEPWEKGSRKTSGQTGMCGGVRGVGAGGIVSTAFCLLYKLFTLKLTRKQVNGLITHCDSAYIRALGFMYIRYTQPPQDLWDWFESYLDDDEELDVKAGGGCMMSIGEMLRHYLTKLEWYSTLFPRIPVPIQKEIEKKLGSLPPLSKMSKAITSKDGPAPVVTQETRHIPDNEVSWGEAERISRLRRSASRERKVKRDDKKENEKEEEMEKREDNTKREDGTRPKSSREDRKKRERRSSGDIADDIAREKERQRKDNPDDYHSRSRDKEKRYRSRSRDRRRSRSHSRDRHHRERDYYRSHSRDRYYDHRLGSRNKDRR
uniref:Pre-mRNA-splicing factor 38 n=1 Tax=Strigamia maritima TaxID=126957 RepID=T1JA16_STRMM